MKDARGHGSNGRTGAQRFTRWNEGVRHGLKGLPERSPNDSDYVAGHRYGTNHNAISNYDAAKALGQGHPKAEGVGPHSAMAGSRDYDSFGRPRDDLGKSEYDEYSRDLSLRSRNGGIGSGGRR